MTDDTQRMKDVDHTHPYDDTSAGALFARGPVVAADGGERNAVEGNRRFPDRQKTPSSEISRSSSERGSDGGRRDPETEPRKETMKDVDHTPPHGEDGAKRVFERGDEYDVVEE